MSATPAAPSPGRAATRRRQSWGTIYITMPDPDLEAAWDAVHDALPVGWSAVRPVRHDEEHDRPWHAVAVDYRTSSRTHEHVQATGRTEAEALNDLAELLRNWHVETTREPPTQLDRSWFWAAVQSDERKRSLQHNVHRRPIDP